MATVVLAAGGAGLVWVLNVRADAPSLSELKPIERGSVSEVVAADGSRLGYIESDAIRDPVAARRVPEALRQATIAIEDENFYEHSGVDWGAVARAAWENAEAGFEVRQGGSTITQQLVKNLYIPDPEETLRRKIIEATLAEELEKQHTKEWILNQYLNTASYGTNDGRTAVGVEAAAHVYFSEHVANLDRAQAALLAGLPQAPSEYNPLQNPKDAQQRRNEVLGRMYELGKINRTAYLRAQASGLGLRPGYRYQRVREPYFFDYVEQELIDRYGVNTVRQGGLTVYTTINRDLQDVAEQAVDDGAARLGGPAAAPVATDVGSGDVLAMASSSNYATDQYNLAANGHRQPGSSFKPFVLATALKQGIDPDRTFYDGSSPVTLRPDPYTTWTVNNAEPGQGVMSITDATTNSVNAVYAQLDLDVGADAVAETARAMGITSPLDGFPAEGIGGLRVGVSPLEMSNAYATLANGGVHHQATAISRVVFPDASGRGQVDNFEDPGGERVLDEGVAAKETEILKTVITSGTATAADIGCPAAGKTGTTDGQTDAWFVGYTPQIATAVWTGYPTARTSMGSAAFGGTYAAPIWRQFMPEPAATIARTPPSLRVRPSSSLTPAIRQPRQSGPTARQRHPHPILPPRTPTTEIWMRRAPGSRRQPGRTHQLTRRRRHRPPAVACRPDRANLGVSRWRRRAVDGEERPARGSAAARRARSPQLPPCRGPVRTRGPPHAGPCPAGRPAASTVPGREGRSRPRGRRRRAFRWPRPGARRRCRFDPSSRAQRPGALRPRACRS